MYIKIKKLLDIFAEDMNENEHKKRNGNYV